jgi:hypothetical protein
MRKRKKTRVSAQKPLDKVSKKKRGRPGIRASLVVASADNARLLLEQFWDDLNDPLFSAETPEAVAAAFAVVPEHVRGGLMPPPAEQNPATPFAVARRTVGGRLWPTPGPELVLRILKEPKFPKTREARIRFLADSLAGRGEVSPRRSRDICATERAKPVHYITRRDFYIECTCGYKGPALRGACPKCGTRKTLPVIEWAPEFSKRF